VRPWLFETNVFGWHVSLPTYGVLLATAFLLALWFALREARRAGLPHDAMLDLWITALISGIVGAKLLLYVLDLDYYISNPRAILSGLQSAGVFYGGLIVAVLACVIMIRRKGLPGWKVADIAAPAIALGQSIGRLGCFAAGCCYGKETALPWGVTFTDPEAHRITGVPLDVKLHPSQIYLSLADLILFGALLWISRRKRYDGQVFLWYLFLYSILRGSIEFTRGDPRGELLGLSTSQIIALILGPLALFLIWRRRVIALRRAPAH
jgi:phosphatidylglycerol:prolipoprotein diacylglycerol transferase